MTSVSLLAWKIEPLRFQLAAQFGGVGDVAVVGDGDAAFVAGDGERLRVEQHSIAGGRVARVADGELAGQLFRTGLVKISATCPMDFWQWISRPSLVEMPALSWPRCCSA